MPNYVSILENNMAPFAEAAKLRMHESIKASIAQKAQAILEEARVLCPVSVDGHFGGKYPHPPGNLRDSLHAVISAGGHYASVRADVTKAFYCWMAHFGTVHYAGSFFLYKAKERVMGGDNFSKEVKDNFDQGGTS